MKNPFENDAHLKLKLIPIFIVVTYLSLYFHEVGHWLAGTITGNEMYIKFNFAGSKSGEYVGNSDLYATMGGPIATIFLIIVSWILIEKYKIIYLYPVVIVNFFIRLFPHIFWFNNQDEAKISAMLEIGKYTMPTLVLVPLFLIVWRNSYVLRLNYKNNIFCVIVSLLCVFSIVVVDYILWLQRQSSVPM